MKITVEFDSIEDFETFQTRGKATRARRAKGDEGADEVQAGQAPAPMQPPAGGAPAPAFTSPSGFPGAVVPAPGVGQVPAVTPPPIAALVQRINTRIDGAIGGGQPADAVLNWFRQQCGAEAANATLDQIKQTFLPKLSEGQLGEIAKLMNA